ncbi:hypothetical protein GQ600_2944 [Phytophthora cactorum]|nr:hypothetical protein GQ600_2944 [Phytophthora cactorum]
MSNGMTNGMRRPKTHGGPEYYQHFNMFTQPFHLNHAADVVEAGQLRRHDHRPPRPSCHSQTALNTDTATGLTVSIIQRYIFHRIVGESRTIFTWKTLSEGEGIFSGMSLKENGWACLQESVEDESTVVGVCVNKYRGGLGIQALIKRTARSSVN